MKIYLSGPMDDMSEHSYCRKWRKYLEDYYKDDLNIEFRNPIIRNRKTGKFTDAQIVEEDKADIEQSNLMLVNYYKPSVGTSMEILYAWENHVPVITVDTRTEKQRKVDDDLSPWIKYHSTVYSFNPIEILEHDDYEYLVHAIEAYRNSVGIK